MSKIFDKFAELVGKEIEMGETISKTVFDVKAEKVEQQTTKIVKTILGIIKVNKTWYYLTEIKDNNKTGITCEKIKCSEVVNKLEEQKENTEQVTEQTLEGIDPRFVEEIVVPSVPPMAHSTNASLVNSNGTVSREELEVCLAY